MNAYPKHHLRNGYYLDGVWDIAWLGEDADLDSIDISEIEFTETMVVPGTIDACPAYAGKRGTWAYGTTIAVTPGYMGRLKFHGLGMWCRVIIDGTTVCEKALPYSGFCIDVPASDQEIREVIILIDNRFDKERVPLQEQYFDFYAYGGIFRSVEWYEYDAWCIDRVRVTGMPGSVKAEVLFNGDVPDTVALEVSIDNDYERIFEEVFVADGKAMLELGLPDITQWSPESPDLHIIQVICGDDDIIERFGIREIAIADKQILINGEPIKLLGYCRHEVHPQFGPALPAQQLLHDIQILKDLGCNFVRGAHYPQDQRFLDLCDEMGLLVFEESLAWQPKIEDFNSPAFCDAQEEQTRLMVRNSINHPSVFLWGFFNEGNSHEKESVHIYTRLAEAIREEDSTRLVSFACNRPYNELNYDICDIICINTYPGWYTQEPETAPHHLIVPALHKLIENLDEKGQGDKPFIVSEIGAGAIYGWRDPLAGHWSEQYQAAYLQTVCDEVLQNDRINGLALWQFCDGRTYSNGFALGRPRTFNNKGTVDEYRRPKMAYEVVKKAFTK